MTNNDKQLCLDWDCCGRIYSWNGSRLCHFHEHLQPIFDDDATAILQPDDVKEPTVWKPVHGLHDAKPTIRKPVDVTKSAVCGTVDGIHDERSSTKTTDV